MHTDKELIECKTVLEGTKQVTLRADYLQRLVRSASIQDRYPEVVIRLDGRDWIMRLVNDDLEIRAKSEQRKR